MKLLLFVASIYSLIIYQCVSGKNEIRKVTPPKPLPTPSTQIKTKSQHEAAQVVMPLQMVKDKAKLVSPTL